MDNLNGKGDVLVYVSRTEEQYRKRNGERYYVPVQQMSRKELRKEERKHGRH